MPATTSRTNTIATGWIARAVAKVTGHAFVRVAELAAVIDRDVHDGDNDFTATNRALTELGLIAVHGAVVQWDVADGDYTAARVNAEKLAS